MGSLTLAVVVVIAVAALGLFLRRLSQNTPPPAVTPVDPLDLPDEEAPEDDFDRLLQPSESGEVVAITSDGWSFMPTRDPDRIDLVPPRAAPDPVPTAAPTQRHTAEHLVRGELIAARIRRGAPDHDPWRLEALGRESEYQVWRFETEQAAHAALALVERCVVETPRDEDGMNVAIGDAEFDAARREQEAIEAELAAMPDVDESEPPPRGFTG